jgi:hypothetical protein
MNKLLLTAATLIALTVTAQSLEVGATIHFDGHNRGFPVAGCTNSDDAIQTKQLWLKKDAGGTLKFVDWISGQDDDRRTCVILNDRRGYQWKVADKQVVKSSRDSAWFCLESTIDFSDTSKPAERTEPYCFWVWMLNK